MSPRTIAEWFAQCRRDWRDDPERERLLTLFDDAYDDREEDPDVALEHFHEAKALAESLDEPWWALFFEKAALDARIHYLRDFRDLVEPAEALASAARRVGGHDFPGRFAVRDTLIAAQIGIDAEGYEQAIREELDALAREIGPEPSADRYCLLARERELAQELGRWDEAEAIAMRELDLSQADPDAAQGRHFAAFTYASLCRIVHERRQWAKLEEIATDGEPIAREAGHMNELATILAWRAAYERYRDRRDAGTKYLRDAATKQNALESPPRIDYFWARIAYYEIRDDYSDVLQSFDEALASLADRNQLLRESRLRTTRLRVILKMDRTIEDEVDLTREVAKKLRYPDRHLAEIDAIERGE